MSTEAEKSTPVITLELEVLETVYNQWIVRFGTVAVAPYVEEILSASDPDVGQVLEAMSGYLTVMAADMGEKTCPLDNFHRARTAIYKNVRSKAFRDAGNEDKLDYLINIAGDAMGDIDLAVYPINGATQGSAAETSSVEARVKSPPDHSFGTYIRVYALCQERGWDPDKMPELGAESLGLLTSDSAR